MLDRNILVEYHSSMIKDEKILSMVKGLMKFPFPQICVHLVACDLLSALEESGYTVTDKFKALADAVVKCDNREAINIVDSMLDN